MAGLSRQVVWAGKLLFSNPYNDVLKDHFILIKQAWLRKAEQLKALILSSAELRTYQNRIGEFRRPVRQQISLKIEAVLVYHYDDGCIFLTRFAI